MAEALTCPKCGNQIAEAQSFCPSCGNDLRGLGGETDTLAGALVGKVIDGRYRILKKLGEGGMGSVYRVEHVRMGKVMALKVLRPDVAKNRTAVERFGQEARTVSKLSHPNTLSVFDFGELEDGSLYIAMEYIPGTDLAELLRREGKLPEKRALGIAVQVLRSLAEAHDAGIVHRDIKPANVMLMRTREKTDLVKVVDFGIAKLAEATRAQGDKKAITGLADFIGTPAYMSPEQARGTELDARADLYSVAAMLFELLTGRGPFVAPTPLAVVTQHLTDKPPTAKEVAPQVQVSDAVEAVLQKALAKSPADRFSCADEMRAELERALGAPVGAASQEIAFDLASRQDWDAFARSFRRRHLVSRALGLLVLLGMAAAGAYGYRAYSNRPRVPLFEEEEPNEMPSQANLIAPGRAVVGHIGARSTRDVSDRDVFEFAVETDSILSLEVSGVPNINLQVEVFADPPPGSNSVRHVALVDDSPTSGGEELSDVPVAPGHYFVRLMDRRRRDEPDGPPRENTTDPYTLTVRLSPARPFQEQEPNNEVADAMPVTPEIAILGQAGTPGIIATVREGPVPVPAWSIDFYRLEGAPPKGSSCAILGGLKSATLRLTAFAAKEKQRLKSQGSVQVREGRVGGVCAKGAGELYFQVRVDVGNTGQQTYPIIFVTDQEGGFNGLVTLASALPSLDRAEEARLLLERALELLPGAADVDAAKDALAALPEPAAQGPAAR